MQIGFSDDEGRSMVLQNIDVEVVLRILGQLDNELRSSLEVGAIDKPDFLTIVGPDRNRVTVHYRKADNDEDKTLTSRLIDTELEHSDEILDIGYHGGSDPVPIYNTVPLAIAREVIRYYFDHHTITNHGRYKWEGSIKPD